jgi:hypothetical protein
MEMNEKIFSILNDKSKKKNLSMSFIRMYILYYRNFGDFYKKWQNEEFYIEFCYYSN